MNSISCAPSVLQCEMMTRIRWNIESHFIFHFVHFWNQFFEKFNAARPRPCPVWRTKRQSNNFSNEYGAREAADERFVSENFFMSLHSQWMPFFFPWTFVAGRLRSSTLQRPFVTMRATIWLIMLQWWWKIHLKLFTICVCVCCVRVHIYYFVRADIDRSLFVRDCDLTAASWRSFRVNIFYRIFVSFFAWQIIFASFFCLVRNTICRWDVDGAHSTKIRRDFGVFFFLPLNKLIFGFDISK